jgi:predicted ATPase
MSDPRNKLQNMFELSNRYQSFGNVLTYIHVKGVRCHENTVIDIESPITAFCGLNGTGKSTLLHLAAAAYKTAIKGGYYNINDFIITGILDPHPFEENASVDYKIQDNNRQKSLRFSRNEANKRWNGYKSRMQRTVLFIKVSSYLPKIEQRDFIVRKADRLIVSNSQTVDDKTREWTSKILGYDYSNIHTNTVGHSNNTGKVLVAQRGTKKYSESHMGFGEGRTLYLINSLEKLPDKSLVLLEEPEISLHPSAQHQLGQYLIDVVARKKHQIMLTTHSEFLLNALPAKSRIYLHRGATCIEPIPGLSSAQAKSLMTEGYHKSLCILVEDPCAKAILEEILRIEDKQFLMTVGIHVGGDKDTIAKTAKTCSSSKRW